MAAPTVAIIGAKGRMGQTLCRLAPEMGFSGVTGLDMGDSLADRLPGHGAVIDFSVPDAAPEIAALCASRSIPLVVGTTGHSQPQIAAIHDAARQIPIVFAPNFSVGVNTLFWLTRKAAEILGPDFDLEIVEMHHNQKKDSPSGTAKRLAEILCEVRDLQYERDMCHGREGLVGARTRAEIGMHAVRGGDVVGDHTVMFAAQGERVELTHKASSRETFARGALRAALWAIPAKPGLYDMQSVLGLT